MTRFRFLISCVAAALLASSSGCLFHTRKIVVQQSTATILSASFDQLVTKINTRAEQVRSLNATVNIDTSVGGEKKGQITDYKQISGYILLRRPGRIRMIGLFPIVRNKAFDMVSDGAEFKLYIPISNKFYVGHNEVVNPQPNPLENLRPQAIYDALLLHPIHPDKDIAVLENDNETVVDAKTKTMVKQPTYVVDVIRKDEDGKYYLHRKVIFDRTDLIPDIQIIFDKQGNVVTEARYQVYKDFNGIQFPTVIQIKRPQEEYQIQLTILKLTLNEDLKDEQFALQQPAGAQLINLDQRPANAGSNPAGPSVPGAAAAATSPQH
jgi:outer membrane lipoprotein-sorting protein